VNDDPASSAESEKELLEEFAQLWEEADQLWEKHDADPAFGGYVSSDYEAAYEILSTVKRPSHNRARMGARDSASSPSWRVGWDSRRTELRPNRSW